MWIGGSSGEASASGLTAKRYFGTWKTRLSRTQQQLFQSDLRTCLQALSHVASDTERIRARTLWLWI